MNRDENESRPPLIPTRYKTRLSRDFSFPIGAEMLSEHLAGAPQFAELIICFSDVVSAWKSKFQRMIAEGAEYAILSVRLRPPPPCDIYVYPVKRELKHVAQEALISEGLPKLREWMLGHSAINPMKVAACEIVFSPPTKTVHLVEKEHWAY